MNNSWFVLLPPVLVIASSFATKNVLWSLILGMVSALFIAYDGVLRQVVPAFFTKVYETTELSLLTSWSTALQASAPYIAIFLLTVSMLTVLLQDSGAIAAYVRYIQRYLKKSWHAQAATMALSLTLFVDDYFSSLTVGAVMKSATDSFRIPRLKLALLTNTIAAPLTILVPVSSWVAQIVLNLNRSGMQLETTTALIAADAYTTYLTVIPYLFYSFFIIGIVAYFIVTQTSVPLVAAHEKIAQETGNVYGGAQPLDASYHNYISSTSTSIIDFFVPMGLLFSSVFFIMLYLGDAALLGGSHGLVIALQQAPKSPSLCIGSCITLFLTTLLLLVRRKIMLSHVPRLYARGIGLMYQSIIYLMFIWSFSSLLCTELATGQYLASLLSNHFPILLLPVIFFMLAMVIGVMMGSAWGAMGILIPIALDMVVSFSGLTTPVSLAAIPMMYPLLGAVISGAVVSNNISPISDTLLMATKSSGAYHADVVKAQAQLSMPIIVATGLTYVWAGCLVNIFGLALTASTSLFLGAVLSIALYRWSIRTSPR